MKQFYSLTLLFFAWFSQAQIINIPDPAFKNALVNTICSGIFANDDVDTNNDGEIQLSEAQAVTYLAVDGQNITSMSGIENFTNLEYLSCSNNLLSTLDVSMMPNLNQLFCSHNQLASLILDTSHGINSFDCSYNQLTSLVLGTGSYEGFHCENNLLSSINVSVITFMYEGWFQNNQLTSLEFGTLATPGFDYLSIGNNPLTSFTLPCSGVHFSCYNTAITTLDMSHGDLYDSCYISNNPNLQYVNFKNGMADGCIGTACEDHYQYQFGGNPMLEHICTDSDTEGNNLKTLIGNPNLTYSTVCDSAAGQSNIVSGSIAFDCSGTNQPVNNLKLDVTQNTTTGNTFTNISGQYITYTGTGQITVAPHLEIPSYFTVSPADFSYNFTSSGNTQTADFCIVPNGIHPDLDLTLLPLTPARPGFDATYKIVLKNKGTQTQSGTISLAFDESLLDFVSATPAVGAQSAGMLIWNFSTLNPLSQTEFIFTLNVNSSVETPAVNIGDILSLTAQANSADTDETPDDNAAMLSQTVTGSYDPNDKAVSEGSQISLSQIGDYLHYTIRFQNTGTAPAENVRIGDVLSAKLDPATAEVISSSHTLRTTRTGNRIDFFFDGINLPASATDEPASHGYVTFKVRTKNTLVLNDVVQNTANIYFDYNAPVVTNTVTTTVLQLATPQFDREDFILYPNPAKNTLTIELSENRNVKSISIYNILGQIVMRLPADFSNGSMTWDISGLVSGTYLVEIISDKGKTNKKFIKI